MTELPLLLRVKVCTDGFFNGTAPKALVPVRLSPEAVPLKVILFGFAARNAFELMVRLPLILPAADGWK